MGCFRWREEWGRFFVQEEISFLLCTNVCGTFFGTLDASQSYWHLRLSAITVAFSWNSFPPKKTRILLTRRKNRSSRPRNVLRAGINFFSYMMRIFLFLNKNSPTHTCQSGASKIESFLQLISQTCACVGGGRKWKWRCHFCSSIFPSIHGELILMSGLCFVWKGKKKCVAPKKKRKSTKIIVWAIRGPGIFSFFSSLFFSPLSKLWERNRTRRRHHICSP